MINAFETIPSKRDIPLFVFGDHASRHIPAGYDNLGLEGDDLTRHIAWDPGTEQIVRTICEELGSAGQLAGVSRLLIDLNRVQTMDSLIPEISDSSVVPGNQNLSATEKQNRIDRYYTPYHTAMGQALDRMGFGLAVSIHSFTPQLSGQKPRELDIGLLFKVDEASAEHLKSELLTLKPDWRIAYNEPYSAFDLNHTIDANVSTRGLPHLSIEVNQALIDTDAKARDIGRLLGKALEPLIKKLETA